MKWGWELWRSPRADDRQLATKLWGVMVAGMLDCPFTNGRIGYTAPPYASAVPVVSRACKSRCRRASNS